MLREAARSVQVGVRAVARRLRQASCGVKRAACLRDANGLAQAIARAVAGKRVRVRALRDGLKRFA
jgi:hypothetical protein